MRSRPPNYPRPPNAPPAQTPAPVGRERTPRVVVVPQSSRGLQHGINQLADVLSLTLGPHGRLVVLDSAGGLRPPELLDKGGVIARRLVALPDPSADVGAMYLRGLLTHLDHDHGDGTATAAVLFQHVYNAGLRWITAGGNAMLLRRSLEQGLAVILTALGEVRRPFVGGAEALRQAAFSVCQDHPLAAALGEILDTLGPYGPIELRTSHQREIRREFLPGSYWDGGLHNPEILAGSGGARLDLEEPALLVSNLFLDDPAELAAALNCAYQAGQRAIVLVAAQISPAISGLLAQARQSAAPLKVLAVQPPAGLPHLADNLLHDLAVLTGARPLLRAAGDTLAGFTPPHLGRARWAWADRGHFGLVRGQGDPSAVRAHVADVLGGYRAAPDVETRAEWRARLGNLHGGAYALWLDGPNDNAVKRRRHRAELAIHTLRALLEGGCVPGGGWAFMACRPALTTWAQQATRDEDRAAARILLGALEAPFRAIVTNAGQVPGRALASVAEAEAGPETPAGPYRGFDVLAGHAVDLRQAGLLDPAETTLAVAQGGIASAALALTIDVLVHHRLPELALEPEA